MRRAILLSIPLLMAACEARPSEPAVDEPDVSSGTVPDETRSAGKLRLRDQTLELRPGYVGEYRGDEPLDEARAVMADTDPEVMEPSEEAPAP